MIDVSIFCRYQRIRLPDSINIPFPSVELSVKTIESLNVPNLETLIQDKIIVIVSAIHENAILVRLN